MATSAASTIVPARTGFDLECCTHDGSSVSSRRPSTRMTCWVGKTASNTSSASNTRLSGWSASAAIVPPVDGPVVVVVVDEEEDETVNGKGS